MWLNYLSFWNQVHSVKLKPFFYNKLNDLRCHVIIMYTKVTTEKY